MTIVLKSMESLDLFRHSWQQEIAHENSTSVNESSQTPIGDLCRIASTCKHALEDNSSIPTTPVPKDPSNSLVDNSTFTIGIGTFVSSNFLSSRESPSIEPPAKKLKKSSPSLLEELIRDINESTDIPFFNVSLPREIALHIFDYLSIQDVYSCLQVCRSWHSLSNDELLWYNLYKRLKLDRSMNNDNDDSWKTHVKNSILSNRKIKQNFKNHQCRTTKLTNHLGIVLTCANSDDTNIVGGYSTGIIRTWPIEAILNSNANDEEDEQLDTPDIIYESTNTNPHSDMSSVKSVGFLKNDVYALHDDGLLELWLRDRGNQPRYTHQLVSLPIKHVANDENILCATSSAKFSVWNFNEESQSAPQYQELNFLMDMNDRISSFCMSNYHTVPISIIAGHKSLWCLSLSNLAHRCSFYSLLESNYIQTIPLDIHSDEPLGIIGIEREIKLFDLQSGRCNVVLTNYRNFPANVHLIRANQCPLNEFVVAFDNYQISTFDRRQKQGAVQHFYNHYSPITTLQMDSWKLASTDSRGSVRLWDRRMYPHSLWNMNPQPHPVTYCSFDKQTLIYALTPMCKHPDLLEYQIGPDMLSGHIYVCNFKSDVSTRLDEDLKICTSSYDAPEASNRRIALYTPYDTIE